MARRHSSFLLRCWDLGTGTERIEIEHVQSGARTLAKSVAAATEWICAQSGDGTSHSEPEPGDANPETRSDGYEGRH